MSSSSKALATFGEVDNDLHRYRDALRRRLPLIVAAAAAGALVLGLFVGDASSTVEVRVSVADASDILSTTELGSSVFEEVPKIHQLRDYLSNPALVADPITSTAEIDTVSGETVVVKVNGPTAERTIAASEALLSSAEEWIGELRQKVASDVTGVLDQQRVEGEARIAEIDSALAAFNGSDALRESFIDERTDVQSYLAEVDSAKIALSTFASTPRRLSRVDTPPESANSRPVWAAVGALLGALVAGMATLIHAHFDRRIRSRRDLETQFAGVILPLVPRSGSERDTAVRAARTMIMRLNPAVGYVVPVDDAATETCCDLTAGTDAVVRNVDDLPDTTGDRGVVLVCSADRSDSDTAGRIHSYVVGLGYTVTATALVGVRSSVLARASS